MRSRRAAQLAGPFIDAVGFGYDMRARSNCLEGLTERPFGCVKNGTHALDVASCRGARGACTGRSPRRSDNRKRRVEQRARRSRAGQRGGDIRLRLEDRADGGSPSALDHRQVVAIVVCGADLLMHHRGVVDGA